MSRIFWLSRVFGLGVLLMAPHAALPQPAVPGGPQPRLQPVAETRLLMDGLNRANFRGLDRHLAQKPTEVETWTFIRGQSLLIAETGNLLMLRPPRNQGQDIWLARSADLREAATTLARSAAAQDYTASRKNLVALTNACNACHQTFRVPVTMTPFEERGERGTP